MLFLFLPRNWLHTNMQTADEVMERKADQRRPSWFSPQMASRSAGSSSRADTVNVVKIEYFRFVMLRMWPSNMEATNILEEEEEERRELRRQLYRSRTEATPNVRERR